MAHFNSCSRLLKYSVLKNSAIVIPSPSHNFFIVATVALLLRLLTILLTVDCVTPLIVASLLIVMLLLWQSSRMRFLTASPVVITSPPNSIEIPLV